MTENPASMPSPAGLAPDDALSPRQVEERTEALLRQMTREEKSSLCHAGSKFATNAVERLGVPRLVMSDGPHGVRQEFEEHGWKPLDCDWDTTTYLPTGVALAATWNPGLGYRFGQVLGAEARARGKDIILGPGFNILRDPRCGRGFEYLGEDPALVVALVPGIFHGIQEQDVAACAKHFALNSQEWYRGEVDARPDERTFREVYAPGFEAAVHAGDSWTVMGAYNKFHGQWCCHNRRLLVELLKQEWEYSGAVVSDWCAVHDVREAALNGLDIEMGSSNDYRSFNLADPFLELLRAGEVPESVLDDKARRILRLLFRIGKLGGRERQSGQGPCAAHSQTAREIANEAPVLLRNDGLLPLDAAKLKRVAVIGENAAMKHALGGGSSGVKSVYEITPLEGLRNALGPEVEIIHAKGYPDSGMPYPSIPAEHLGFVDEGAGVRGWHVTWIDAHWCDTPPVAATRESVDLQLAGKAPVEGFHRGVWSADFRGTLTAPESGRYKLALRCDSSGTLQVDGKERIRLVQNHALEFATCELELTAGQEVELRLRYDHGVGEALLQLGWCRPGEAIEESTSLREEALAAAKDADAVLFFGGLNHLYDNEGGDRAHLDLPGKQDDLIRSLLEVNPRLVVTLIAGGPVTVPWAREVPALLYGWYAGLETGNVLADILLGRVNPSGKLPFTMPKRLEDTPAVMLDDYRKEFCDYREGTLVGHRWYDAQGIEPAFPFGHGLSYTSFELSGLAVEKTAGDADPVAIVSCTLANTGARAGKQTVQLYVGAPECPVPRAPRELKAFRKVELAAGEETRVELEVSRRDLSFWDVASRGWKRLEGEIHLEVGFSSRDVRLKGSLR